MPLASVSESEFEVTRGTISWFFSSDIVKRGFCSDGSDAPVATFARAARVFPSGSPMPHQPWYRILYIQVLIDIAQRDAGKAMKPLGDGFISLIKMMIAPAIFCTVVHGIASIGDMRKVGRIGGKTLLYFEIVSTVALLIGLLVGHFLQPGAGFNIDPATLDPKSVASYVTRAKEESFVNHLLAIIPSSYFDSLAKGDLLQVLLVAILSGFAIAHMGKTGEQIAHAIDVA
eukprot:gene8407-11386_t